MKELIELVAKKLVDHPESVQVSVVEGEKEQTIELVTHPEDVGRVIGKNGKTAQAIRVLLSMAATKAGVRVSLRIADVNGVQSSEVLTDESDVAEGESDVGEDETHAVEDEVGEAVEEDAKAADEASGE